MSSTDSNTNKAIEIKEARMAGYFESTSKHYSLQGGSMASYILRFNNINFTIGGKGNKKRNVLENISGLGAVS